MADLSVCIPYTPEDEVFLADAVASVDLDCEIVTVCDTEHRGAGWTRNQCVLQASYDWILKLDADDRLLPGTLAELWAWRNAGAIVATASTQFTSADGEYLHRWEYRDTSARAILTGMVTPASAGCLLYHGDLGGYPETCGAYDGWAFVCRAVREGAHVVTVPGTSYLHRLREGSYWSTRQPYRLDDLRNAFALVNEMYAEAVGV